MESPQFFEVGPVLDPDQRQEEAPQVEPVQPNQEQMESLQLFEVGPVSDTDQRQEDEASQVEPARPNQEQMEGPQFFEGRPELDLEQQQEAPQYWLMGSQQEEKVPQGLQGDLETGTEEQKSFQPTRGNSKPDKLRQYIKPEVTKEPSRLTENIFLENEVHLNIVPMISEFLRPSWEGARREILQQIISNNEQERISIYNINDAIDIARQEFSAYRGIHRILLEYITWVFRMQSRTSPGALLVELPIFLLALEGPPRLLALDGPPRLLALEGPPRLLALEGPPRLLALEGPPRLLALEGPPRLLALEGPPRLSALECPPLLAALESPILLLSLDVRLVSPTLDRHFLSSLHSRSSLHALVSRSSLYALVSRPSLHALVSPPFLPASDGHPLFLASEEHASISEESEMLSKLQEKGNLVAQEPSKRMSLYPCEQGDPFYLEQPDATLNPEELQKLPVNENQEFPGPGVPEFSDPRELLKDLHFGEMKAGYSEMENMDDLNVEHMEDLNVEHMEDLNVEHMEDLNAGHMEDLNEDYIEDLETEAGGNLERPPSFLPESQRPNEEVINIPEDVPDEVVPNAAIPNNGGNRPFDHNGRCRDGEADMESREQKLDEAYPEEMTTFVTFLMLGILLILCIGTAFNVLSYELGWKGNRTVTDTVFNVTTPMTTPILNATILDVTASMNNLSSDHTDMEI